MLDIDSITEEDIAVLNKVYGEIYNCSDNLTCLEDFRESFNRSRSNKNLISSLSVKFEDLPLHINDEIKSHFAVWRLKIGK